jgi:hypothetical protein
MKNLIFVLFTVILISCGEKDDPQPLTGVQKGRLEMEFRTVASRVHVKYGLNWVTIKDSYLDTNYFKLDTMVAGNQQYMGYISESMSEHGMSYNTLLIKYNGDTLISFNNQYGQCGGSGMLP